MTPAAVIIASLLSAAVISLVIEHFKTTREAVLLPGWRCSQCSAFNGTAKADLTHCRCCDARRPT